MRESVLQTLVVKELERRGFIVIHIPNQLCRGKITHAGIKAGVPDLLCIKQGKVFFIELKAKTTLSPKQKAFHALLQEHGVDVFVVRSLENLNEIPYILS